jgi:hypothetical protein
MQKTILYLHGMGGGPRCGIATGLDKAFLGSSAETNTGETCNVRENEKTVNYYKPYQK